MAHPIYTLANIFGAPATAAAAAILPVAAHAGAAGRVAHHELKWTIALADDINTDPPEGPLPANIEGVMTKLLYRAALVINGAAWVQSTANDGHGGAGQNAATIRADAAYAHAVPKNVVLAGLAYDNGAIADLMRLASAWRVKDLSADHMKNFFNMKGFSDAIQGNLIVQHLPGLVTSLPDFRRDPHFMNLTAESKWMTYHTTAVSTPALVERFRTEAGGLWGTLAAFDVWEGNRPLTVAALAAPWNPVLAFLIPERTIAYTAVWLKAARSYPDDWYQGNRCYESMNSSNRRRALNLFRRYLELVADDVGIAAMAMPALTAAAGAL